MSVFLLFSLCCELMPKANSAMIKNTNGKIQRKIADLNS